METLAEPADDALKVQVLVVEPLGSQNLLTVKIGNNTIKVATHPTFDVVAGPDRLAALPGREDPLDRSGTRAWFSIRRSRAKDKAEQNSHHKDTQRSQRITASFSL